MDENCIQGDPKYFSHETLEYIFIYWYFLLISIINVYVLCDNFIITQQLTFLSKLCPPFKEISMKLRKSYFGTL